MACDPVLDNRKQDAFLLSPLLQLSKWQNQGNDFRIVCNQCRHLHQLSSDIHTNRNLIRSWGICLHIYHIFYNTAYQYEHYIISFPYACLKDKTRSLACQGMMQDL